VVEDMTWITYDVAKKLMTDFCKSFCFCGTQFGTFTAMDECFSSFSLSEARVKPIQALTAYTSVLPKLQR